MPIRFACPSCQQPIEIDDQWAGQSVACPYCKRVVTAPTASTWPAGEIPVASPASGGFAPPPPPGGYSFPQRPASAGSSAVLGLTLVLLSGLIGFLGAGSFGMNLMEAATQRAGTTTDEIAIRRAAEELVTSRQVPRHSFTTPAMLAAIGCCLVGIVMAIRAIIAREPRRGMAMTAVLLGILFLCCEGVFTLGATTATLGYVPAQTAPAGQNSTAN